MEDILKKVKSLKDSGLLLKAVVETTKNEAKEHVIRHIRRKFITKY